MEPQQRQLCVSWIQLVSYTHFIGVRNWRSSWQFTALHCSAYLHWVSPTVSRTHPAGTLRERGNRSCRKSAPPAISIRRYPWTSLIFDLPTLCASHINFPHRSTCTRRLPVSAPQITIRFPCHLFFPSSTMLR